MADMTNRELLAGNHPGRPLSSLDRQRLLLLKVDSVKQRCPNPTCRHGNNVFEAAGIDIDDYDFGATKHAFSCVKCEAPMDYVVPIVSFGPGWHWEYNDKRAASEGRGS